MKDEMNYELMFNKNFFNWYKKQLNDGYRGCFNIIELQKIIDFIVNWYEIKYPDKELEKEDGIYNSFYKDIDNIAKYMDMEQLLYRLDNKSSNLLRGVYRAKSGGSYPVYVDGKLVWVPRISIRIKNSNGTYFDIVANPNNGIVRKDEDIDLYLDSDYVILDNVLDILRDSSILDYKELEECIFNHNIDLELRDRILYLAGLKMVYSDNTYQELGIRRLNRFFNEIKEYFNLDLNKSEEIVIKISNS